MTVRNSSRLAVEDYVDLVSRRLRTRSALITLAVLVAVLVTASAIATWIILTWVPGRTQVFSLRVLMYVAAALGLWLLWWRLPGERAVIRSLEARIAGAKGRLRTYVDAKRRGEASVLLPLLERECEALASRHPPRQVVPWRELLIPATGAVVLIGLMALALLTGPAHWRMAVQNLWLGELLAATHPKIRVTPGDVVIPAGVDVIVEARASGFTPVDMQLNALLEGSEDWQKVTMSRLADDKYGFVFVAVGGEVDYYVSSRSLVSQRFTIEVADLPRVTSVSTTLEYPEWTSLPVALQPGGDVAAISGTRVNVALETSAPASEAMLVVNERVVPLVVADGVHVGSFVIEESGSWHMAVEHEGSHARISDLYRIQATPDEAPQVVFSWPGADRQATPIEEVGLRFSAEDDYGVASVAFSYSVNGGPWETVALDPDRPEYVLELEELLATEERHLVPGDVISMYALARDHQQSARTALYFVDVRPFDRRYRESQQMGGGGGGGSDIDIAERQKELLSATWNLISRKSAGELEDGELESEARMIAMLQSTLEDQVNVLIERAGARAIDEDSDGASFVASLQLAVEQMGPATLSLEALELDEAVPAEQRALTHLRTAEAAVPEIDVSLARDSRGGGGMRDSLSELVDLEMDRERNRYEMPEGPDAQEPAAGEDPDWARLEELAARQEQLSQQRQSGDETLASRWQQEKLQRELEALRERLQQRQGGSSRSTEQLEQAISSLESAQQQLQDAAADSDPAREREANRSLQDALDALRRAGAGELRREIADTRRQANGLVLEQEGVMERLDDTRQRTLDDEDEESVNPWRDFSMADDADTKRRMREELARLRRDLAGMVRALNDRDPGTARVLQGAQRDLDDDRIEERLAASAEAFEMGRPLYAADHEDVVLAGLERLVEQLSMAEGQLADTLAGEAGATPLQQVRDLRRALEDARRDGQVDGGQVRNVANAARLLAGEIGADGLDEAQLRSGYQTLGTSPANDERFYQLTSEQLDVLESSILSLRVPAISAQRPRDPLRDSDAAAEYFRALGQKPPDG